MQAGDVANTEDAVARLVVDIAETSLDEDDGIEFRVEDMSSSTIRAGDRHSGVRIRLPATLAKARLAFSVDVSFGDPVTPPPEKIMYPSLRGKPFSVVGYRLTTVVSEKVISMLELGDANTRERDFGDVYRIMALHTLDARELAGAVAATAAFRETEVRPLSKALTDLPARRQASWERWRDRAGMEDELPKELEGVVDAVSAFIDPILSGSIVEGTWDPARREWGKKWEGLVPVRSIK